MRECPDFPKSYVVFTIIVLSLVQPCNSEAKTLPEKTGSQWYPYLEWNIENLSFEGNPFDLDARVEFVHDDTGASVETPMFYEGGHSWGFRFTSTSTGQWSFRTLSNDKDLDGWTGTVAIRKNDNRRAHGFIKAIGNKWGWQGTDEAFIPQYVMGKDINVLYDFHKQRVDETAIGREITEFIDEHGFTGFHLQVRGRWFDLNGDCHGKTIPDMRTYEVLETIIRMVHARGGSCHLWMWGKDTGRGSDGPRAILGAPMNTVDRRNLRYIAARLGPLPGWSMGYGYDTENLWASPDELDAWKSYLETHFGWDHFIGARVGFDEKGTYGRYGKNIPKPQLNEKHNAPIGDQYTAWLGGDYIGYTSYRPLYDRYVEVIEHRPDRPSFDEDRFRIRDAAQWTHKDYDVELTRRGLWHSAMAGGIANIWGHLLPDSDSGGSQPYDRGSVRIKHLIKTYATFFRDRRRFRSDFIRDNSLTDPRTGTNETPESAAISACLRNTARTHYIFYKEDCSSIAMNLTRMQGSQRAVAVDAKRSYTEIDLGVIAVSKHNWQAPYESDWAIAVGDF